jgi:hypothetical protein
MDQPGHSCVMDQYIAAYGKPVKTTDRDPIGVSYMFTKLDTIADLDLLRSTELVWITYRLRNKEL